MPESSWCCDCLEQLQTPTHGHTRAYKQGRHRLLTFDGLVLAFRHSHKHSSHTDALKTWDKQGSTATFTLTFCWLSYYTDWGISLCGIYYHCYNTTTPTVKDTYLHTHTLRSNSRSGSGSALFSHSFDWRSRAPVSENWLVLWLCLLWVFTKTFGIFASPIWKKKTALIQQVGMTSYHMTP